jgi:methyl coenzyme M reductase alpha subunit
MAKNKAVAIFHHYEGNLLAPTSTDSTLCTSLPGGLDDEDNDVFVVLVVKDAHGAFTYIEWTIKVYWLNSNVAETVDSTILFAGQYTMEIMDTKIQYHMAIINLRNLFANEGVTQDCDSGVFSDCSGNDNDYDEYKQLLIDMYNHFNGVSEASAIFNAKNKLLKLPGAKATMNGWYENGDAINAYLNDMKDDVNMKM